jgi:hypothetical protein
MITLFAPARSQPCQVRRPTKMVESTVSRHEM